MSDNEGWRDEPDHPSGFFTAMFGRPMTTEERAEWDAKQSLAYSLLPQYRPNHHCVKCGETKRARTNYSRSALGEGREALMRECRRCSYIWYERTLSEEES